MHDCDLDTTHFKEGGEFARDLAAKASIMVGVCKLSVYVAYLEWKKGEEEKTKLIIDGDRSEEENNAAVASVYGCGLFNTIPYY